MNFEELHKNMGNFDQNKSLEQALEDYSRKIYKSRNEILDNFLFAYVSHLSNLEGEPIDVQRLQLVEDHSDPLHIKFYFNFRDFAE